MMIPFGHGHTVDKSLKKTRMVCKVSVLSTKKVIVHIICPVDIIIKIKINMYRTNNYCQLCFKSVKVGKQNKFVLLITKLLNRVVWNVT